MTVEYFPGTDTALVEFTDHEVEETKEISENIYVDLDREGNLVSMTIEHARTNARLPQFSYQEIATPLQGVRSEAKLEHAETPGASATRPYDGFFVMEMNYGKD
jgi:uncharacterized protein YuzE